MAHHETKARRTTDRWLQSELSNLYQTPGSNYLKTDLKIDSLTLCLLNGTAGLGFSLCQFLLLPCFPRELQPGVKSVQVVLRYV